MGFGEPNWATPGAATAGAPAGAIDVPPVNTGTANKVERYVSILVCMYYCSKHY